MKQKTCFVISSIGNENDEKRRKADALLEYVIKQALEPMGYDVMRADEIAAPNSINRGIVEHLEDSDLVVADIHDHNPNVFYELGENFFLPHIACRASICHLVPCFFKNTLQ